MVSASDMLKLHQISAAMGVDKLVLVGDRQQLSSIDWDPGTGTLWATEPQQWRVLEFSPSGNRVVGSIYLSGGGLFNKLGLSVDVAGDKAYAVQPNGTGSVLVQLDLSTSVVTTISSSSVGSGVAFQGLADGILDPVAQVYYALDRTAGSIVSVPVATGVRTTFSGAGIGNGPAFTPSQVYRIAADFAGGQLYVLGSGTLFAVSLVTGDRVIVSDAMTGTGPTFHQNALAVDAAGSRAFVANNTSTLQLVEVDLATGNRTLLPSPAAPAGGPTTSTAGDLVYDAATNSLLLSDGARGAIVSVDTTTGVRTRLFDVRRGTGQELAELVDATLMDDGHLLAVDTRAQSALIQIDLATGDRSLLSGTGPTFSGPHALALDPTSNRALISTSTVFGQEILAMDLATGDRSVVSPATLAGSPTLPFSRDLVTDGVTAWISSEVASILAIDLTTGARVVLADAVTGLGSTLTYTWGLGLDTGAGLLYVSGGEAGDAGLYSVSLVTGDRTKVSTSLVGAGPNPTTAPNMFREASGTLLAAATFGTTQTPVLRLDPSTGDRTTVVSSTTSAALEGANSARIIAGPRSDGLAVLADDATNTVMLLDPITGERLVLSR